jgi:glutaredoxin
MMKLSFILLNNNSRRLFSTSKNVIKLTLLTKDNCPLCDDAKEAIHERYGDQFEIDQVDITKDRQLFRKYKLEIPVFYYKDKFLMKNKVNFELLDSILKEQK